MREKKTIVVLLVTALIAQYILSAFPSVVMAEETARTVNVSVDLQPGATYFPGYAEISCSDDTLVAGSEVLWNYYADVYNPAQYGVRYNCTVNVYMTEKPEDNLQVSFAGTPVSWRWLKDENQATTENGNYIGDREGFIIIETEIYFGEPEGKLDLSGVVYEDLFSISGTNQMVGTVPYYVGDVSLGLKSYDTYLIRAVNTDNPNQFSNNAIAYANGIKGQKIELKEINTGAISNPINVEDIIKKHDCGKPKMKLTWVENNVNKEKNIGNALESADVPSVFVTDAKVVVEEENLQSITVNGVSQQVGTGSTHTISLSAKDKANAEFTIVATDKLGQSTSDTVVLASGALYVDAKVAAIKAGQAFPNVELTSDTPEVIEAAMLWDTKDTVVKYDTAYEGDVVLTLEDSNYFADNPNALKKFKVNGKSYTMDDVTVKNGKVYIPYKSAVVDGEGKLSLDGNEYTVKGTNGKNDFYTSDVVLSAAKGYSIISSDKNTVLANASKDYKVTKSKTVKFYVRDLDTYALSTLQSVKLKVDQTSPVITGIKDGGKYIDKEKEIVIEDDNLDQVYVNDEKISYKSGDKYKLTASELKQDMTVKAVDLAGNETVYQVTLNMIQSSTMVYLTLDELKVGNAFPKSASYKGAGIKDVTLSWDTTDAVAKYSSSYDAVIKVTPDEGYCFQEDTKVVINEETYDSSRVTVKDGVVFVNYSTKTEDGSGKLVDTENTYAIKGTMGENQYYISNVSIIAESGYQVAVPAADGSLDFKDSVVFSSEPKGTLLYVRRNGDYAKSNGISLNFKMDTVLPTILNVSDGEEIYSDEYELSVYDEHLSELMINDENISVTGTAKKVKLTADDGAKSYTIVTKDLAGNKTTKTIVIKALWMKENVIPANQKVKLSAGEGYQLGAGSWNVEGDSTTYSGGITIFVGQDNKFVFKKQ